MPEDARYPVGPFTYDGQTTPEARTRRIQALAAAPAALRRALDGLTAAQWDTPYREGGWTVRQVAHHLADSHLNAYLRFKLALTEDLPTVKPYDQERFAELADSRLLSPEVSATLLDALHQRWVALLENLAPDEWDRWYYHPEQQRLVSLDEALAQYAWHGQHHVAQIASLRARRGSD